MEAELGLPEYGGPFSDYSEFVLQYGYITMFASALPVVTFFAISEVLLQIRTDRSVKTAQHKTRSRVESGAQKVVRFPDILSHLHFSSFLSRPTPLFIFIAAVVASGGWCQRTRNSESAQSFLPE